MYKNLLWNVYYISIRLIIIYNIVNLTIKSKTIYNVGYHELAVIDEIKIY